MFDLMSTGMEKFVAPRVTESTVYTQTKDGDTKELEQPHLGFIQKNRFRDSYDHQAEVTQWLRDLLHEKTGITIIGNDLNELITTIVDTIKANNKPLRNAAFLLCPITSKRFKLTVTFRRNNEIVAEHYYQLSVHEHGCLVFGETNVAGGPIESH